MKTKKKRKEMRSRRIKTAHIIFNNRQSVMNCKLEDVSASGARLSIVNSLGLPEEFMITLPGIVKDQWVRRAWVKYDEIGVEFI